MTPEEEVEVRVEIAALHARLGEFEPALASLARAVERAPDPAPLREALDALRTAATPARPGAWFWAELEAVEARLGPRELRAGEPGPDDEIPLAAPRLATSTLAELLERQGHTGSALETAEQVLARDPLDPRALALRDRLRSPAPRRAKARTTRLERWLARVERRFGEGIDP